MALKHGSYALAVAAVLTAAPGGVGKIERLDPALDALVAPGTVIEKVAGGFKFTEGPLWRPDGTLWFSDVQGNVVRSVTPAGQVKVSSRTREDVSNAPPDAFIGSNGMAQAPDGSVWMVQHGARQIVRVAPDRTLTPVVSRFEGKRFNSPNDLVFAKDGALYFTDPPYGLAKQDDDPAKELAFNGVYRFANGRVQAVVRDLNRPNGLAFSPITRFSTSTTRTRRKTSSCATTSRRTARSRTGACLRTSRARSTAWRTG